MTPLPVATSRLLISRQLRERFKGLNAGPPPTNCPLPANQLIALRRSFFLKQCDCHSIQDWSL